MTQDTNDHNNSVTGTGASLYYKVVKFLHHLYIDLKNNFKIFIISVVIPLALLIGYNIKRSNTYTASFTIVYEELVRKVYGDRLVKLNSLLQNNRPKARALLEVNEKVINSLNEITATNILGDNLSKDVNTDKIPFIVNIRLNDTSYIPEIQSAIIKYLETGNDYLISKRKMKAKEIEDELNFITNQLAMMDTLKHMKNSNLTFTSENPDKTTAQTSIYEISYELYKKKQELLKKQEMPLNLYVIDDAIVPVKDSFSYKFIAVAGLFIGIFIYFIMVYLIMPTVNFKERP